MEARGLLARVKSHAGKVGRAVWRLRSSGFPWFIPDAHASADALLVRRAARRQVLAAWPTVLRPAAAAMMCLTWPITTLRMAWVESRRWADPTCGDGRWRLFAQATHLALRHNLWPWEAIAFRRADGANPTPGNWLPEHEYVALARSLVPREAVRMLADKQGFKQWLAARDIPVPRSVAVVSRATYAGRDLAAALGHELEEGAAIVVKPRTGSASRGVEAWLPGTRGFLREADAAGAEIEPEAMARLLCDRAQRDGDLIVESRIPPGVEFSPYLAKAVPVLRLTTAQGPDGGSAVLAGAILKIDAEDVLGSGPVHLLEVRDGQVVESGGVLGRPAFRRVTALRPPGIMGMTVPGWHAAVGMVCSAHDALPFGIPAIGWDVALGGAGPVVIEANVMISLSPQQILSGAPVLEGPLGPMLASWVRTRLARGG